MKKIIIVVSNYYEDISNSLLQNALKELKNFKVNKVIKVPGVFEIPVTIAKNINKVDGVVALGCVIKGKTPHFEFISTATTNGILTCLNKSQAIKRVSKGSDAAKAVISVITQK